MPATKPYQGVLIPDEAVAANQDKRVVYVLGAENAVVQKDVRLGPKVDGYRVIQDGLKGDETVVVNGIARVRPGIKVAPDTVELPPSKT